MESRQYQLTSDADIAHHLTCAIPVGRWTNYGTIAEAIDVVAPGRKLNGWRVAMLLPPTVPAPWHRLRNQDAVFNVPVSERRDYRVGARNSTTACAVRVAARCPASVMS